MMFFGNRENNHLAAHLALVPPAWSLAGIFFTVYLLRAGLSPAQIFQLATAILAALLPSPLVAIFVSTIELRRSIIFRTLRSGATIRSLNQATAVRSSPDLCDLG